MTAEDLVRECRQRGISLQAEGGKLVVEGPLTPAFTEELRGRKAELLALLAEQETGRVYINAHSELVIPRNAPMKYRWWDPKSGGQPIADTLLVLDVSRDIWGKYVDTPYPVKEQHT